MPPFAPGQMLLDESDTISKWVNLKLVSSPTVFGLASANWPGANGGQSAALTLASAQTNWSSFQSLRFWAYSSVANNAEILVTLSSPGPNGAGDYYFQSFHVDWTGWKVINLHFSDFRISRAPVGFTKITNVVFNSRGWWLKPLANTQLTFDRIALNKSAIFPDPVVQPLTMTVYNSILIEPTAAGGPTFPDMQTEYGMQYLCWAYPGSSFDPTTNKYGAPITSAQIQQVQVTAMIKYTAQNCKGKTIAFDLENWQTISTSSADAQLVAQNLKVLGEILDWSHAAAPGFKFGYYMLFPRRDYLRALKGPTSPDYIAWQKENDSLAPIASKADMLFPSLYTFYDDPNGWVTYAKANVAEAKRYNKPIYPFLWPRYHDSNAALKYKFIDAGYWALQLQTMKSLNPNGITIWDYKYTTTPTWDPSDGVDFGWWQSTLTFLFP